MVNSKSMQDLIPEARSRATFFIAQAELELSQLTGKRVKVQPTSTFRDSESQDELFARGRTAPGKIVTNARGGESWHNFQRAMDFVITIDGKVTWDKDYYRLAGKIAQESGLTWGGDWNGNGKEDRNDWDLCHVQYDADGMTLAKLQNGMEVA